MIWKYDGTMGIYEDTGNPRNDRRVLELGCGLGRDTDKIGNLAAAAPEMFEALEEVMSSYCLYIGSHAETLEMKRARTLVGLVLDKVKGNLNET